MTWMQNYMPEVIESLNPPASLNELIELERLIGVSLPTQLRDLYLIANGQNKRAPTGLWYGLPMLSVAEIMLEWQSWYELFTMDYMQEHIWTEEQSSYKEGYVKPMYTNPRWIPLADDSAGNYFGLDYDPGPKGQVGQVINFGRDEFVKYVIADSFGNFLKWYVEQLESGNYWITEEKVHDGGVKNILNTKYPPTGHFLESVQELFK